MNIYIFYVLCVEIFAVMTYVSCGLYYNKNRVYYRLVRIQCIGKYLYRYIWVYIWVCPLVYIGMYGLYMGVYWYIWVYMYIWVWLYLCNSL